MLAANGQSPPFLMTVIRPALPFPSPPHPASDHAVVLGEITHSGGEENMWIYSGRTMTEISHCRLGLQYPLGTGKEILRYHFGLTAGQTYYYRIVRRGKLNPEFQVPMKLWLDAEVP